MAVKYLELNKNCELGPCNILLALGDAHSRQFLSQTCNRDTTGMDARH